MRANHFLPFALIALITVGCSQSGDVRRFSDQPGGPPITFSPKLTQFLVDHPAASITLSNAMLEALSGRKVEIYYYYSKDDSLPKAHHHYMGDYSTVGIFVRENQPPCDECISILFEVLNSRGEKRFLELFDQAKSGTISKQDFVTEVIRQEFRAAEATHRLLPNLGLTDKEMAQSGSCRQFGNIPSDFKAYLGGGYQMSYEQLYDKIRSSPQRSSNRTSTFVE